MDPKLAKLLLFLSGAAAAMSGAALVREASSSATATYYTYHLELNQRPASDGGNDIDATASVAATVPLKDGGVDIVDLGGSSCADLIATLTTTQRTNLQQILTGSANCGKNAK